MQHPKARQEDLVVQEISDELVIYDLDRNQVHSLNPTAALVWQHCDGQTSPAQLATGLQAELNAPQAEDLVWLTLDRLAKAHLLDGELARPKVTRITRRQALRALGIGVGLLPVITSIVAPTAAHAATCFGTVLTTTIGGVPGDCDTLDLNSICDGECSGGRAIGCWDVGGGNIKITCCCP